MSFDQVITLLVTLGAAGAALLAFFRFVIPQMLEKQAREFEAKQAAAHDTREFDQRMAELGTAYQQSEHAVTLQVYAELLGQVQGEKNEVEQFVREEVLAGLKANAERLGLIEQALLELKKGTKRQDSDLEKIKYSIRQYTTEKRILVGLVTDIYERLFKESYSDVHDNDHA